MARFYGLIGFGDSVETPPDSGVWIDTVREHNYTGDVIRNTQKSDEGAGLNENVTPDNRISVVADAYAVEHFFTIIYVEWVGIRWTVTSVEVRSPRLILSLGEVYNGPTP